MLAQQYWVIREIGQAMCTVAADEHQTYQVYTHLHLFTSCRDHPRLILLSPQSKCVLERVVALTTKHT